MTVGGGSNQRIRLTPNHPNVIKMIKNDWDDLILLKLESKGFERRKSGNGLYYLINTICLPNNSSPLNTGYENATLTGWGKADEQGTFPRFLKVTDIYLRPHNECRQSTLCAAYSGSQSKPCVVSH